MLDAGAPVATGTKIFGYGISAVDAKLLTYDGVRATEIIDSGDGIAEVWNG